MWMWLDGDVVAYFMSYVVCVCVFGAEKDDMSLNRYGTIVID